MKETYYISVEAGRIDKERLDDHHTYYQVELEGNELNYLKILLNKVTEKDKEVNPIFLTPLSEGIAEDERDDYQKNLKELYGMIYQVGTVETQANLKSLGILDKI